VGREKYGESSRDKKYVRERGSASSSSASARDRDRDRYRDRSRDREEKYGERFREKNYPRERHRDRHEDHHYRNVYGEYSTGSGRYRESKDTSREKHGFDFNERSLGKLGVMKRESDRERYKGYQRHFADESYHLKSLRTAHDMNIQRKQTAVDYDSDWSLERPDKVEETSAVDYDSDWSLGRPDKVEETSGKKLDIVDNEWRRDWSVGRDGYVVGGSVVSVKNENKEECSSKIEAIKILHESSKDSTLTLLCFEGKAIQEDASDEENRLEVHDDCPRTPGWDPDEDFYPNSIFGLESKSVSLKSESTMTMTDSTEQLKVAHDEAITASSLMNDTLDREELSELSEYEIKRAKNIENNRALMITCGIDIPDPSTGRVKLDVEKGIKSSRKTHVGKTPTRKSPRMSALPIGALNEQAGAGMEFDNFEDVAVRRYSRRKKPLFNESSLSPRSPIVDRMVMRVPPVHQPMLGPFSYDQYESFLHEKVRKMRPVFGFTEMLVKNLDEWIIHDRKFVSTQKARCQLMIKTKTSTILDNLDDILNLLGYSKNRKRNVDVFTRYVWCPHIVLVNIFKGCTKQNLAYDRQSQSYFHPGIDVDVDTTRKNPNIQMLCPVRLRELSERIRGDSGKDAEADLVPVEKLPEFADFEKIVKMELDPEKYFFPFMSLNCEENRELFEVKAKSVDKDNADLRMVRIPGVLNLTEKRENQILAVYQCLQDSKLMSEDEVEVRFFKPVGERE
jgi:hypothetical protein